ncbi:alpha/beta fold hydrolase [Microvirga calopogonii]|uniref:alpha/beta fold hydrolase n=1 Tax=Microvirga calopogonii TaxID=2078013 RepID=UPI0013B36315|nr:alpha/beta hydrolase [Microvirga calopogonii]
MPVLRTGSWTIDYIEAGSGSCVILLHSSVAGNRQWRTTVEALQDQYHVIAINLFGYGQTSPWPGDREQTLADQGESIQPFIDQARSDVALVGHSFGGAVAMTIALHRPDKVSRLILLEPIPFCLLDEAGRVDAYAEVLRLRDSVKRSGGSGDWEKAAAGFADYWSGEGTWAAMSPERQKTFTSSMPPNLHEWDAVLGMTARQNWSSIQARTLVVWTRDTKRPIREIIEVLREKAPHWQYRDLNEGGHMFPLTQPGITSRLISEFLCDPDEGVQYAHQSLPPARSKPIAATPQSGRMP